MAPPNLRYINQSAPFWDWIASFEQSAADHPFFGGNNSGDNNNINTSSDSEDDKQRAGSRRRHRHQHPHGPPPPHHGGPWAAGPWASAWGAMPWARGFGGGNWHGEMPHRGGPPPHGPHPHGPPHYQERAAGATAEQSADEKVKDGNVADKAADGTVPDPPEDAPGCSDRDARRWARRERKHARREQRGFGGPGGHHGHHHPYGRGGWGGMAGRGGFRMLSDLFGPGGQGENASEGDWKPEADAFDTESSYVVHVSLPGAHKEDIGVTWDAEKSELNISGVVHRPGDEEFLKTLALDERKTGAFDRKIRLGTRALPAHVDVQGITAKLENGILIVDVPKLNGEFVEVKKVDIE